MSSLAPITDIIDDIRAGKMVVLIDEEDRENEGDLVMAAEFATPEAINFMARFGRGPICLTLTEARCRQLGLQPMVRNNRTPHGTAFTTSIEAASGVTTGISAHDRARTVQVAVAPGAGPQDLVTPGHIFPLTARDGGVLVRAGHTEAGCDLARLAGLTPASVICEILNDDGSMARLPDLVGFAREHGLKIGAIRDLIEHRAATEQLVERVSEKVVQTPQGRFRLSAFEDRTSGEVHFALSRGEPRPARETLVRVHEAVSVLDFLDPAGGGHSVPVQEALAALAAAEAGVLVLLMRPQSGRELLARLHAGSTPPKWDTRLFGIGAQILRSLGVGRMKLLGSPRRMPSVAGFHLEVTGFVPVGALGAARAVRDEREAVVEA